MRDTSGRKRKKVANEHIATAQVIVNEMIASHHSPSSRVISIFEYVAFHSLFLVVTMRAGQ